MNRLRPEGLLLVLILTALPGSSAHAWPADSRTPSRSRVEITTIDIQGGRIDAFQPDHEACAGLSAGEPAMEKTSCLAVKTAGGQASGSAMLAFAGDWNFDVPGMHDREYHLCIPASAGKCNSFERPANYRRTGVMPPLVDKVATLDLVDRNAPREIVAFRMQPTTATQHPNSHSESIDFDPIKSDEDNGLNKTQVSRGGLRLQGVNVAGAWGMFGRLAPRRRGSETSKALGINAGTDDYAQSEHYHWGGLLAQSLFFNVIENGFRAASDDQIRNLLANKPFWHDYAASIRQFNMRRWNDGDDFLVNYTGHPMQGAVSGFIEIQNDPRGRELEISANRQYWESRFKAFLWATVYSTHSEISPLGEAGIGNEGGWTYPIHCKTRCTEPGTYKHFTNNTGWVDFIVTPTAGTLWMLAEDTLDRFVSDRIQGDNRASLVPKIIRGALNPSRTMANAVRFKAPWYRDWQQSAEIERSRGVHLLPSDEEIAAAQQFRRVSIAPYFRSMPFGTASRSCTLCVQNPGIGIALDYGLARWVSASVAVENQPNPVMKDSIVLGSTISVGFGLRLTYETPRNNLSFAVRPGFLITQVAQPLRPEGASHIDSSQPQSVENAAITLALSNDIKLTPLLSMRFSIGDTIVRTGASGGDEVGIGSPPYLSWLSKDKYTNRSTWSSAVGPVLRF
jgi:hypothetical protein